MFHFARRSQGSLSLLGAAPRGLYSLGLLAGLLLAVLLASSPAAAAASTFHWYLGPDVAIPSFNSLDIDPAVIKDGSDLWVVYTGGGGDQNIRRWKGTTMDNLVQQPLGVLDASFRQPYGDDRYWIGSAWRDPSTGTWFATVHVEFHYNSTRATSFRRIGLAVSNDKGATWHYQGDIITSDSSYNQSDYSGSYFNDGQGDQKLFVDNNPGGYFYIYYRNDWMNKSNFDDRSSAMRVARCQKSAKMAPGCWTKWYQGAWNQPGLKGHESSVFADADSSTVFYNSYTAKFLAVGLHVKAGGSFISEATDLNLQNWAPPTAFCSGRLRWYNWPVDPSTWSRMSTGQTFRLYSSDVNTTGPTKYMDVTLASGSSGATCNPQVFYDDFEDGNANGWQPNGGTWDVYQPAGASKEYRKQNTEANLSTAGQGNWVNYAVQGYVFATKDVGSVGILGRVKSPSQFYQLAVGRDGAGSRIWSLYKYNNGGWTLLRLGPFNFAPNTYYLLRLDMNGTTLTGYVSTDWGKTFVRLGSATDGTFGSGKIGVRSSHTPARFDGITVTIK